jgi:hypothetical protein
MQMVQTTHSRREIIRSNQTEISHRRVSWQTPSFDKKFAAPVGWVGIENGLRERPRMSPWVEERALAFAIHVIRGFSEYSSTCCLGASKEFVDRRDTKCDGVRRGALLCRRSGVSVYAGFGDDDRPIAVQELPAILRVAETFGEWKGRCKPRDCFGHVGVVQDGYYGRVWCRSVLLQHEFRGYQCFPNRLTRHRRNYSV